MAVESWVTFHDFRFLYAHIRNNRCENHASWGPGEFVFYAKNCTRMQKISEIEETFVNNWVVR